MADYKIEAKNSRSEKLKAMNVPRKYGSGGVPKPPQGDVTPLPITPQTRAALQRRVQNADSDDDLHQISLDAAKYGISYDPTSRKNGGRIP